MGSSRRGFYFRKITISGILGHVNFEQIALLPIFGPSDGGDGGDGGGGDGFPRTLSIWLGPGSRPGTKYPVRGIPHFDIFLLIFGNLSIHRIGNHSKVQMLLPLPMCNYLFCVRIVIKHCNFHLSTARVPRKVLMPPEAADYTSRSDNNVKSNLQIAQQGWRQNTNNTAKGNRSGDVLKFCTYFGKIKKINSS